MNTKQLEADYLENKEDSNHSWLLSVFPDIDSASTTPKQNMEVDSFPTSKESKSDADEIQREQFIDDNNLSDKFDDSSIDQGFWGLVESYTEWA